MSCRFPGSSFGLLSALLLLGGPAEAQGPPDPAAVAGAPTPRRGVDAAFERDLSASATYREVSARFIAAAGGDAAGYERALGEILARLRDGGAASTPAERAERLRGAFFSEGGFSAAADLSELDNLFPDRILLRRRGYCLGLTLVLLDLCDRLAWRATAVSAPRHTFLRLEGDSGVNVETTLGGAIQDDEWYRRRFGNDGLPAPLRPVSPRELAGHLLSNVAFALLERGDTAGARLLIERALRVDPRIVEARTNLGVCAAREERYEEALAAFDATLEEWPGDPQTRLNRVNALLPLGRRTEAIAELVDLLDRHPESPAIAERAAAVRDRSEDPQHWPDRQRLSLALVRREERRRGRAPGLAAIYFRDARLGEEALRRSERDLSFQWGWGGPGAGIPTDHFSARFEGWLAVPADDRYTFFITCSDGVRIWIDGRPVVDAWTRANDNFPKGSIDLLAGTHELRVEYFEGVGEAGLKVLLTSEREDAPFDLPALLSQPTPSPAEGGSR